MEANEGLQNGEALGKGGGSEAHGTAWRGGVGAAGEQLSGMSFALKAVVGVGTLVIESSDCCRQLGTLISRAHESRACTCMHAHDYMIHVVYDEGCGGPVSSWCVRTPSRLSPRCGVAHGRRASVSYGEGEGNRRVGCQHGGLQWLWPGRGVWGLVKREESCCWSCSNRCGSCSSNLSGWEQQQDSVQPHLAGQDHRTAEHNTKESEGRPGSNPNGHPAPALIINECRHPCQGHIWGPRLLRPPQTPTCMTTALSPNLAPHLHDNSPEP